jgi:hypothetical protein
MDKIIPIEKVYQEFLSGRFPNNQANKTAKITQQSASFKHASPSRHRQKQTNLEMFEGFLETSPVQHSQGWQ